jgi:UDP-N-acetylglucosamine 4,6-dehydratase/5-epimerase
LNIGELLNGGQLSNLKISNSVVTITGGTGSFGSTMVQHVLAKGAAEVRVFSRDESKQDVLRNNLQDDRVKFYIGDVRDQQSVDSAIKGSDLVFHAAALKQVPSCEFFPLEAVATNVQGSANVLRSSLNFDVGSVVCLSTDKAVYPINAMGMSKALMEKTATSFARNNPKSKTKIAITRYGNVMFSRGSVIPLFIKQIKSGKPITVTDLNMTRFLMSLSDSVDLVNYAFENASSGDLLVRKAPAATVEVLVEALKQLFDVADAKTQLIGVRHGEKIYESLLSTEEMAHAIDQDTYFRVPLDTRGLDYSIYFEEGESRTEELSSYTSHNTARLDVEGVKKLLLTLPEVRQELNPS